MFIPALFIIANLCKQPRYHTIDEWIKKIFYIYIHIYIYICAMEYYSAIRYNDMWFEGK
jgi:hypothetical protein